MAAYLDIEACINQNFGAFAPGRRVNGKWLFYYFDFHYRQLREIGGGTNQGALNCYLLKRIRLPLPPLETQREVASALEATEKAMIASRVRVDALQQLKRSLMHDLLTGTKRIDPALFPQLLKE